MYEKPDLSLGSYEFIANKTYMKRDKSLSTPTFIFIIDVSQVSCQNGFLSSVIESIKDSINSDTIPYFERTKVAFITYDTSIHFYCLNKKLSQPQMLCVSDENIFLPSTIENLIVDLGSSKKMTLTALDLIQSSFSTNTCKDSNKMFSAINAGYLLAKGTGGKLLVFNASHSMTALPKMKSNNTINIPKDELIYSPTDEKQLSTMGINMTNENISCDLFIASETYTVRLFF
jgi:protein transport protein SEC24